MSDSAKATAKIEVPHKPWKVLHDSIQAIRADASNPNALKEALQLAREALDSAETEFPSPHLNLVKAHETLADLYLKNKQLEPAEGHYRNALLISNDLLPSDLHTIARITLAIAVVTSSLKRYQESLAYYEQALPMLERLHGKDFPALITHYQHATDLAKKLGSHQATELFLKKALYFYEQQRGPNHPYVADTLNNLGTLYTTTNRLEEAESTHLQSASIRETNFGKNHPDVAQTFGNLAVVYHLRGDLQKASEYYDASLTIYEKHIGISDQDFIVVARNFADLLRHLGKDAQADKINADFDAFERSLSEGKS